MAVCVAVIGKDNSPKYIKCNNESNALQFHNKVHTSIDIIEEKLNVGTKAATDTRELFLGLLFSTEEHKIFGYATNTKIKFVVVLQSTNPSLRDNDVRMEIARGVFQCSLQSILHSRRTDKFQVVRGFCEGYYECMTGQWELYVE